MKFLQVNPSRVIPVDKIQALFVDTIDDDEEHFAIYIETDEDDEIYTGKDAEYDKPLTESKAQDVLFGLVVMLNYA